MSYNLINTYFSDLTLYFTICVDLCVVKFLLDDDDNDDDDDDANRFYIQIVQMKTTEL